MMTLAAIAAALVALVYIFVAAHERRQARNANRLWIRLTAENVKLRSALKQIADRPDDEMAVARTLHYDMRGWARAALEGEQE